MQLARGWKPGRGFPWAGSVAIPVLLLTSAAYGQQGGPATPQVVPCTVDNIRLRIATGGDDLRGGNDNLNVTIRFGQNGFQGAPNVNNGANWPNGSVHVVDIKMNQPVPLNEIKSFTLDHLAGGGLTISLETLLSPAGVIAGFHTDDNWDMQSVYITAFGGGNSALIAMHGAKRFTGSDPILGFLANIPTNSCDVGQRFGHATPPLNSIQPANSTSSKYGSLRPGLSTMQRTSQPTPQQLQNNRLIQHAVAHTVQIGPRASPPGEDGGYSALIGLLRKQSAAARSLLLPYRTSGGASASGQVNAANNAALTAVPSQGGPMLNGSGGANQTGTLLSPGTTRSLNPQPYPPKSSQPQIGAGQTMSATVSSNPADSTMPSNMQASPSGPTRQQPAGGGRQPATQTLGSKAPPPTALCRAGIGSVDGATNGVWFSPVAGQDGQFVIQGCGFGSTQGEVYLSGVQYDTATKILVQHLGTAICRDCVPFQVPPNAWSDRQIIVQIDANASGFYDTNNVTLNVKTASGQIYQLTEMNFLAARADQILQPLVRTPEPGAPNACYGLTLTQCLIPGINLAVVNASLGPLSPEVESPTNGDWLSPAGQSVAVVRGIIYLSPTDNYSVSFPSGMDTYQFNLAPGFQFDSNEPVQLNHASMDAAHCESLGGVYSNSGNWSVSYTSASSFQVHWEEEACSAGSAAAKNNPAAIGSTSGFAGFSAYQLQITVIGPRGVTPWANSKVNPLVINQIPHVTPLKP